MENLMPILVKTILKVAFTLPDLVWLVILTVLLGACCL